MIKMERSIPVNPPGAKSKVSRAEVWQGLVLKADNALPFVPQMTYCKVVEREAENRFVREIEFRGDRMRERVTLVPEKQVTFERLAGPVLGTIQNHIDEDASGELSLRFAFELQPEGMAPGSKEEKEYAANMEKAYLGAVDATLAAIRKVHDHSKAPEWARRYFGDVDAMKMEEFLAHHHPDARVVFANNPAAEGVEAIRGAIGGLWAAIDGISHRFVNVWGDESHSVLESQVTYARKDGRSVTVPCVSIVERTDGKVRELRIHIDTAPVFA